MSATTKFTPRFAGRSAPTRQQGSGHPPQNVMFVVKGDHVPLTGDPKNPRDPKSEYVIGLLMHDVVLNPGDDNGVGREVLRAKFDEKTGVPLTEVRMFCRPPAPGTTPDQMVRDVVGLKVKRGAGDAILPGGIAYMDTVWTYDKAGEGAPAFSGRSFHGVATVDQLKDGVDPVTGQASPAKILAMTGMMRIEEPTQAYRDSGKPLRQSLTFLDTQNAVPMAPDAAGSFMADLREKVAMAIEDARDIYHSNTAFAVVAHATAPGATAISDRLGEALMLYNVQQPDGSYVNPDLDTTVKSFIDRVAANEHNRALIDVLEGKLPGYQLTFVPGFGPSQGLGNNPYAPPNPNTPPGERQRPRPNMAFRCSIYDVDDNGKPVVWFPAGFMPVALAMTSTGGGISGKPYGYLTRTIEPLQSGEAFMPSDLPTAHTSPGHLEAISIMGRQNQALASLNGKLRQDAAKAQGMGQQPAQATQAPAQTTQGVAQSTQAPSANTGAVAGMVSDLEIPF
jgi:hypothetical protein